MSFRNITSHVTKMFTLTVIVATIASMMSSATWFLISLNDNSPPFGHYFLTIEPNSVAPGEQYWARWHIERIRGDCRIGFTTFLNDSEGKEYVLVSRELGSPSSVNAHPGEIKSYARQYTMPTDASLGTASMTANIQWVCNDVRHALGLIDFGQYNIAQIEVVAK